MLFSQDHLNEQALGIYCSSSYELKSRQMLYSYNECINSGTNAWAVQFSGNNIGMIIEKRFLVEIFRNVVCCFF